MADKKARSVTIFGAGVAGLTAAHELADRGFDVEVIDPDIQEHVHSYTLDRGIGGMARSQWACRLRGSAASETLDRLAGGKEFLIDDVVVFNSEEKPADPFQADEVFDRAARLIERLVTVDGGETDPSRASLLIIALPTSKPNDNADPSADYRTVYAKRVLTEKLHDPAKAAVASIQFELLAADGIGVKGQSTPADTWLFFHVPQLEIFPAEHGFRFFPSFYRHIFDSFKRIPIRNPHDHERTHATVRENLLPSESLGFSRAGKVKAFFVPRHPITSFEEARGYLRKILGEVGYELSDIKRFALKILEYMTSCTERRKREYEHISWADFVERAKYSPVSREHLEYGPEMAAALRGSESDARTQGNIFLQLHMDQVRTEQGPPDCTLNGPTSSAWLNHWQDYLLSQNVRFTRGTLVGFKKVVNGDSEEVLPVVVRTPDPKRIAEGAKAEGQGVSWPEEVVVTPKGNYCVLALSLPGAAKAAEQMVAVAGGLLPAKNDFAQTITFAEDLSAENMQRPAPVGPLQHLSGIQFYFDVPVNFWRGHTLYLDSEWGLTSIAQLQFWGRPHNASDGYRGILSVDIGTWDRPYKGKLAWDCDPQTLATYAWEQIKDHHDDAFRESFGRDRDMPTPIAYAIDANIVFNDRKKDDKTPFLVNRVSAFPKRPGRLIDDQAQADDDSRAAERRRPHKLETSKQASFFDVYLGRYVVVGAFTKTYTRLTSMEAANESARHGVNALLRHAEVACEHSQIWDPEDHEFADLQWFRDLDRKRFEDGRPHLLRTMGQLADLDVLCRML